MSIRITRWNVASKSDEEDTKFLLAIFLSLIVLLHLDSIILLPLKNIRLGLTCLLSTGTFIFDETNMPKLISGTGIVWPFSL